MTESSEHFIGASCPHGVVHGCDVCCEACGHTCRQHFDDGTWCDYYVYATDETCDCDGWKEPAG